jgi:kumamolisin
MQMSEQAVIPGSAKRAMAGSKVLGPVDPDERVEVTLVLRRREAPKVAFTPNATRPHLTREAYAEQFGASPQEITRIETFARANHLQIDDVRMESRSVSVAGRAEDISRVLRVELHVYQNADGTRFRGRTGPITIPIEVADLVQAVLGLDNRPTARAKLQRLEADARPTSFLPTTVAELYDFPKATGKGQTIAIIELGGGFRLSELDEYFTKVQKLPRAPRIKAVSVDGIRNRPGIDPDADGEVMLDIQVAGAVAPDATIVVYFAPNTDRGFLDAITTAIHDQHNRPGIISISWGSAEAKWTAQALAAFQEAFEAAAALGITVCAAAGDAGSTDGLVDGLHHTDYPASDPMVLACGGTRLVGTAAHISSETVWNNGPRSATGGGISDVFARPLWQGDIAVTSANPHGSAGRGVPDVAGNADPVTGYQVLVDGQLSSIGGTSAVAPLWAGLVALLNELLGANLGFLHPLLYANRGALRDVAVGTNGGYSARPNSWDACTGLGTPNGAALAKLLVGAP